jgi:tetrahydromethanopterin S-methyltransferase subunit G
MSERRKIPQYHHQQQQQKKKKKRKEKIIHKLDFIMLAAGGSFL